MIPSKGWYDYNWNPVIGCKHGCPYCYARPYALKREWIEDFTIPEFYPDVLNEPVKVKGKVIFVCAFADLFGDWVSAWWIEEVLKVIRETPLNTYVFLTKNPRRYAEFDLPDNCYAGVTIESKDKIWRAGLLLNLKVRKFCSIEPLLEDFSGVDLSMFDWVVAGYQLYKKRERKEREWMKTINHNNLFIIQR